ncbi:MAG: endonuclease/exonuclease/phosphatase family protein [Bryobacteraceae bacterium]|nr:endonuclease/exonuclease/phosphatase family protein [Bryobacteraceae bacterium]
MTSAPTQAPDPIFELIRAEIRPALPALEGCRSTRQLLASPVYGRIHGALEKVLKTPQTGNFRRREAPARERYRFLAWNIERGIHLERQIEALREHEYLSQCDVLLITETDIGMARSKNREVAREMAEALGMDYCFVPSYISLVKGSGLENLAEGDNEYGLHGDAILSRYPLTNVRVIPLENGIDKFAAREKRLGSPTVIAADVELPGMPVTAVSIHLDAHSTQHHRFEQMRTVLDGLKTERPVVLGGDWNTTTYDSSGALPAILGFWRRVFMGVGHVMKNHYLHPYRYFERELFDLLEARGFDWRSVNVTGEHTLCYDVSDPRAHNSLLEWVPPWCFPFIRWSLREHHGRCPLKLDWFAVRGLKAEAPVVLHEFREGREAPLSDHDPIGVDIMTLA